MIPNCPKKTHNFAFKKRPLRARSCCYFLPSKRRPLRGPSCGSQLFKRDQLFYLQKGGRFAPVVVVIFCLQKGGRFAAVVVVPNYTPIQKGGRFAKRPIILPSKRRPLLKPFKRQLFILYLCSCPKKAAASRPLSKYNLFSRCCQLPQINCRRVAASRPKSRKSTERFYFLVPRIN